MLPAAKLIVPTLDDELRKLNYAPALTSSILALYALGLKRVPKDKVDVALARRLEGRGKKQVFRLDLFKSGTKLNSKLSDSMLAKAYRGPISKRKPVEKKELLAE